MIRVIALLLVLSVLPAFGQTKDYFITVQVPGQGRTILKLGPLFVIDTTNGILNVNVPTNTAPKEVVNVQLARSGDGTYMVPAGATNVKVFVNGIRYQPGGNYTLAGDKITPIVAAGNWPAGAEVVIDYLPATTP